MARKLQEEIQQSTKKCQEQKTTGSKVQKGNEESAQKDAESKREGFESPGEKRADVGEPMEGSIAVVYLFRSLVLGFRVSAMLLNLTAFICQSSVWFRR